MYVTPLAIQDTMQYNWALTAMARPDSITPPAHNAAGTWPTYGWLGLGLIAVFWPVNWLLTGLRTHWAFFPLWLGFCLTVDAATLQRTGDSLLTRNRRRYVALFFYSSPVWWLFEAINWRTQNWIYIGREYFTNWEYVLFASLSFSTVMPAVFGAAELVASLRIVRGMGTGPVLRITQGKLMVMFVSGLMLLAMLLIWPRLFFPAVWFAIFLIVSPTNAWMQNRTIWSATSSGDWRPVVSLTIGCVMCGFFWEMWNFFSYPKWIYHIPFFDFLHVFEMPLLGYGGYLPFALELFTLYHFLSSFADSGERNQGYLRFAAPV